VPDELRSAVWHSLIAKARIVICFDHNFGPGTPGFTLPEEGYKDNRTMASAVNARASPTQGMLKMPFRDERRVEHRGKLLDLLRGWRRRTCPRESGHRPVSRGLMDGLVCRQERRARLSHRRVYVRALSGGPDIHEQESIRLTPGAPCRH
jgi:hypothetical protein